jgi:hypothetical protein
MYYMMDKTAVDIALNEGIHEATIQCISVLMIFIILTLAVNTNSFSQN